VLGGRAENIFDIRRYIGSTWRRRRRPKSSSADILELVRRYVGIVRTESAATTTNGGIIGRREESVPAVGQPV